MARLVDTFARGAQAAPARLQQLLQWKQREEMRIENEASQLARTKGQMYARQYWLAEHEILTLQPEWSELKELQRAPSVPRIGQVTPNPQPGPEQPPTATERGTGQGSKWNPANWFQRQQTPKQTTSVDSPSIDPKTHLINVPPTSELRDHYMRQIDNNPVLQRKPKRDAPDKDVSILDPYAEVSIGGETLRPRHNEIIKQLIPHRKKYLDHLIHKIDEASTPIAKDRAYRNMILWLDQQHRRDLQLAEMTKVLRETVPPEYQQMVQDQGGTLPPVPTRQKPVVGPVPEVPPEVIEQHKKNVQQRRQRIKSPPADPTATPGSAQPVAPPAAPAAPVAPGTIQRKRTRKPKAPAATPPPLPKKSAVEQAEAVLRDRQLRNTPWYKR